MRQRIAISTCRDLPHLFGGEQSVIAELERFDCEVEIVSWDDVTCDWARFDAVVIRCTWDYHEKLSQFTAWLRHLEVIGVRVLNDLETLRWNLDKRYLFELQKKGVNVISGVCLEPNQEQTLLQLLDTLAVGEMVVKPVQSAGAWRTLRVNRANLDQFESQFEAWRKEGAFLVQEFMPEILTEGEWSLVFFDGEYSHSLLKHAKAGDFRVQSDHGGTVEAAFANHSMQQQAKRIIDSLAIRPTYARVDGVCRDGHFYLMELELVEPELFLEVDPLAPRRFAMAIMNAISTSVTLND